jgi:hypothetical protein
MPTDGPARPTRGATPVNNPLNPPSLSQESKEPKVSRKSMP